jgi:hypothetical protein
MALKNAIDFALRNSAFVTLFLDLIAPKKTIPPNNIKEIEDR